MAAMELRRFVQLAADLVGRLCRDQTELRARVAELTTLFDRVVVTRYAHPRSMALKQLAAAFKGHGVEVLQATDVPAALSLALSLTFDQDPCPLFMKR